MQHTGKVIAMNKIILKIKGDINNEHNSNHRIKEP